MDILQKFLEYDEVDNQILNLEEQIVYNIFEYLTSESGFYMTWQDTDDDLKKEILVSLVAIVRSDVKFNRD